MSVELQEKIDSTGGKINHSILFYLPPFYHLIITLLVTSMFDIQTSNKVFTVVLEEGIDAGEWIKACILKQARKRKFFIYPILQLFYWLKSGCSQRYEKVNAEAQKRNYQKSDTLGIKFITL